MRSQILLILLFIYSCATATTIDKNVLTAELIDYGICEVDIKETIQMDSTATGKYNDVKYGKFSKKTSNIEPVLGNSFGIKYVIREGQKGRKIDINIRAIHPPINGKTKSEAKVQATIGTWRADYYTFQEPYELIPGIWTLQAFYQDKLLLEKSFTVRK